MITRKTCAPLLLAALVLTALTGCERITPVRTLPAWVRGVYIPMINNKSYEPGLEEDTTRLIQEAFLFDGRLDVVPKHQADLIVVTDIIDWRDRAAGSSGDKVTTDGEVELTANVSLYQPYNTDTPVATLPPIVVIRRFNTDVRSVDYEGEPQRKREVLEYLAREIVLRTITGFPAQLGATPVGDALPTIAPPAAGLDAPQGNTFGPQ